MELKIDGHVVAKYERCTGTRPEDHTMGSSLQDYVFPKIHEVFKTKKDIQSVVIDPVYQRDGPFRPSASEKRDKLFNWQRPTADVVGSSVRLSCFPGVDYVRHYGALVATYFNIIGRDVPVMCRIPIETECMAPLLTSNLKDMGKVDTVVIGYVDHLVDTQSWEGYLPQQNLFAWHIVHRQSETIAYLGGLASFWGDISANLVKALKSINQIQRIIYIAKAGTLLPDFTPNRGFATGNTSLVDGVEVSWPSLFKGTDSALPENAKEGLHVTTYSPLTETHDWLRRQQSLGCTWVDCEVGQIAKACNNLDIGFAYLHLVSDNVATQCRHSLANERLQEIQVERRKRFAEVRAALESILLL